MDEHHTIEDTAIVLGECIYRALGSKRGIERYGYCLPMDDCLCRVALDFGGRAWLVWDADFYPELLNEHQCIKYAVAVANDKDGYTGIQFCRWVADVVGKKENMI